MTEKDLKLAGLFRELAEKCNEIASVFENRNDEKPVQADIKFETIEEQEEVPAPKKKVCRTFPDHVRSGNIAAHYGENARVFTLICKDCGVEQLKISNHQYVRKADIPKLIAYFRKHKKDFPDYKPIMRRTDDVRGV